jgi:hypothetical protein
MPPGYDNSVFVNCPFDSAYRPLFEAVVFAVYDCGFYARCALEVDDSSQVRIQKITKIIGECRLAIHDISRTQLDRESGLPRFNVPFELGIFAGAKAFGGREQRRKACIVLDTERYRYQRFISDIAGQDIREHARRVERVIEQVRDFLSGYHAVPVILPGARLLNGRYREFQHALPQTCAKLRLDRDTLIYRDFANIVSSWIHVHPLPHHVLSGVHKAA